MKINFAFSVFVAGSSCMILEMVGVRMLALYVGTSVTVWTAAIGTVLSALAFGNFKGGKAVDNHGSEKNFSEIIMHAAVSIIASLLLFMMLAPFYFADSDKHLSESDCLCLLQTR